MKAISRIGSPTPAPTGTVLVFPHAGGSPRFFAHWQQPLPCVDLLGVTYPGRDARMDDLYPDSPYGDTLTGLARSIAHELHEQRPRRPLILVGHSMGAFVAYETAVALRLLGTTATLVVSGQDPPSRRIATCLHQDTDERLIDDIVRQNPASAEVWDVQELRRLFLPVIREDYRILETYEPTGNVVPAILAVFGDEDGEIDRGHIDEWSRFCDDFHGVQRCLGAHFYLQAPDLQLPTLIHRRYLTYVSRDDHGCSGSTTKYRDPPLSKGRNDP